MKTDEYMTRQEIGDRYRWTTRTVDRKAEKYGWQPIVIDGWRVLYRADDVRKLEEQPRRRVGRPQTLVAASVEN